MRTYSQNSKGLVKYVRKFWAPGRADVVVVVRRKPVDVFGVANV